MAEKQETTPLYIKEIKFPPSIGDWTAYKPAKQAPKKIKPLSYGFHRISKPELERTLTIHHLFAFEFASFLKNSIKASTDIFSITIEQLTYLDFLKRVSGGIIYNKLSLKDLGDAIFLIDYQFANIVINFSLGSQQVETKIKELTELEESIIQSVFGNVLGKYADCWNGIFEKPTLDIIGYPSIQRETHINLNEVITVVTTNVSVANSVPASITFVYQNSLLKKMHDLLQKKDEKTPMNFSKLPEELLNSIQVPLIASIGSTNITTREITEIEKEDVIALDQKLTEPARLMIGYSSEVGAQPGIKNNRLSARILGSGIKRVKSAPFVRTGMESPEETAVQPPPTVQPTGDAAEKHEEDFELPMEAEDKEEYNETAESMFEEENNTPGTGGN